MEGSRYFKDGEIWKGTWKYYEEFDAMDLVKGEIIFSDGDWQKGEFNIFEIYGKKGNFEVRLVKGEVFSNGWVEEGEFSWMPQNEMLCLIKGKMKNPEGAICKVEFDYEEIDKETGKLCETIKGSLLCDYGESAKGTFQFVKGKDLDTACLIEGKATFSEKEGAAYRGYVQNGLFELSTGTVRLLKNGSQTFPSGEVWEGEFKNYVIDEKEQGIRTFIFIGTVKDAKGNVMEGTWEGVDDGNRFYLKM